MLKAASESIKNFFFRSETLILKIMKKRIAERK